MRTHDRDGDELDAADRIRPEREDDLTRPARALAAGRPEAVRPTGVLGLQRAVGNAGVAAVLEEERSPVHDVVSSSGSPLDRDVRADMESRLGHDFSDVRVHADGAAHDSAQSVSAKAYTVGPHVVFQRDAYDPGSDAGRHVLAHELTHVVQQRQGPVDGTPAVGGISVSNPSDRFEREAASTADSAMSAQGPLAPVQREAATEEELPDDVQTYVQRQEAPEEEPEEL